MTFEEEILALVGSTLPHVGPRAFSSLVSARQNFLQALTGGTLALPCAFVQFGERKHDDDLGIEWISERAPVQIGYFVAVSDSMQSTVVSGLAALRTAIESDLPQTWQAIESGDIDASEMNLAAAPLLDTKMNVFAGVLSYPAGLRVARL